MSFQVKTDLLQIIAWWSGKAQTSETYLALTVNFVNRTIHSAECTNFMTSFMIAWSFNRHGHRQFTNIYEIRPIIMGIELELLDNSIFCVKENEWSYFSRIKWDPMKLASFGLNGKSLTYKFQLGWMNVLNLVIESISCLASNQTCRSRYIIIIRFWYQGMDRQNGRK